MTRLQVQGEDRPAGRNGQGEPGAGDLDGQVRIAGLRVDDGVLVGPVAETADYLVPTGLGDSLDVAKQNCVRAALGLLQARFGMDRALAYAYLSAATDFDIAQVVDLVKGVHARIRKSDFA